MLMVTGSIEFEATHCTLEGRDEPTDFMFQFTGRITTDVEDSKNVADEVQDVGYIKGCVLGLSLALNSGYSIVDVFDGTDQTRRLFEPLWDSEHSDFREELKLDWFGDVLLIEELGIFKPHRGKGIGALAIERTIEQHASGCAVAVLEPFPLQFSTHVSKSAEPLTLDDLPRDQNSSEQALRAYYGALGFNPTPFDTHLFRKLG